VLLLFAVSPGIAQHAGASAAEGDSRSQLLAEYTLVWADEFDEVGRPSPQNVWDDVKKPLSELGDADWPSSFHVWRMDWNPREISLFVDDVLLNTVDLTKTINNDSERANPFHEPHYLLLNLAIGGTNGGDPSKTAFPARFEVDYVRVYQRTARSSKTAGGD
jgi:beta-glucanase (GH16 family)